MARPTVTPDGYPFPYSHFGDTEVRTQLLKDIAAKFSLAPGIVLNMGSGYDITPSDAFPDARVIHVDLEPNYFGDGARQTEGIVDFLKANGFEAYTADELPDDLRADLGINILGPGIEPERLTEHGVLISTAPLPPEGMKVIGVVDAGESFEIIDDPHKINRILGSASLHLVISEMEKK